MMEKKKKTKHIDKKKSRQFQIKQCKVESLKGDRYDGEEQDAQNTKKYPTIGCKSKGKKGGNSEERTHLLGFEEQKEQRILQENKEFLSTGRRNRNLKYIDHKNKKM